MTTVNIHPKGLSESANIGAGTRVGAFAHVRPGAVVGRDCVLADYVLVDDNVILGDRVRVGAGVHLVSGTRIEDDVRIEAGVAFSVASSESPDRTQAPCTNIRRGATLGANTVVGTGITVGRSSFVEPGSVVTQDVPPNAIVRGSPAAIIGYVAAGSQNGPAGAEGALTPVRVRGVDWVKLPAHIDMRGNLAVAEFARDLPFVPKRVFFIYGVPSEKVRGEHAHRDCHQVLLCVSGSARVLADDGENRQEFTLSSPSLGLHLSPMTWGTQYQYSPGSVLVVFASHEYSASDYLRTYDEFLAARAATNTERSGS